MSSSTATPEAAAPARTGPGLMTILIPVLLSTVLALLAVAGGGWWLIHSGKIGGGGTSGGEKAALKTEEPKPESLMPSHVLTLEPMVVNLADAGGRSYLRASVSLRLADDAKEKKEEGAKKEDPGVAATLRDTTLTVLGAQTSDALLASGGLEKLKRTLRQTYALQNVEYHVLDVYITDFLVQRG